MYLKYNHGEFEMFGCLDSGEPQIHKQTQLRSETVIGVQKTILSTKN